MKTFSIKAALFCCSFFFFLGVDAQKTSLQKMDDKLAKAYRRITDMRITDSESKFDSLSILNDIFFTTLKKVLNSSSETLTYPFSKLQNEGFGVVSSPDKNLRVYSWDTWTGGTMHVFDNIIQYKIQNTVKTNYKAREEGDPKSSYDAIYQMKAIGKTIYILEDHYIGSTIALGGSVGLYEITKNGLMPTNIIKTATRYTNHLVIDYDASKMKYRDNYPEFKFDAATKTIFVPLIDGNEKPTGKYITYQFNGKYFEKVK